MKTVEDTTTIHSQASEVLGQGSMFTLWWDFLFGILFPFVIETGKAVLILLFLSAIFLNRYCTFFFFFFYIYQHVVLLFPPSLLKRGWKQKWNMRALQSSALAVDVTVPPVPAAGSGKCVLPTFLWEKFLSSDASVFLYRPCTQNPRLIFL